MGKAMQHAGQHKRPPAATGRRAFTESLEDFSRQGAFPVAGTEQADEAEDPAEEHPDPTISLHPDELEELKAESWQAGHKAGQQEAEEALATRMAGAVEQVLAFMEAEEARRNGMVARLSSLFVESVCQTVEQVLEGELSRTSLHRDLASEAAALARQCESPLSLYCAAVDAPALRAALGDMAGLSLHVSEEESPGHLTLKADGTELVLDRDRWAAAVRSRVAEAVQALAHPPPGQATGAGKAQDRQTTEETRAEEHKEADNGRGHG